LTAVTNGLPEFALNAGEWYAITFPPPCYWCNFTIGDLGLYLRQRTQLTQVDLTIQVYAIRTNSSCSNITAWAPVSVSSTITVDLSEAALPYRLPLNVVVDAFSGLVNATNGDVGTPLDGTQFAVVITPSTNVWWVASQPMPAVPISYQTSAGTFQVLDFNGFWNVEACNPPRGSDYWPSILLTGGRGCPTPTRSATPTRTVR